MLKDDHWYKCLELAAQNYEGVEFIMQMLWDTYPEIVWC